MDEVAFDDPRRPVLEIEKRVRELCLESGADPAEGIVLLLTSAAHMADTYMKGPPSQWAPILGETLGTAIVAADDLFKLRVHEKEP
ncbi:MAG: hypothetical protein AAGD43_02585 [Pseudomonadota bacterium]